MGARGVKMAGFRDDYRADREAMEALFADLKAGRLENAYFVHGAEEFLKARAMDRIRGLALTQGMELMDSVILEGCGFRELFRQLDTPPMISPRRLVIVRDDPRFSGAGKASQEDEALARELPGHLSPATVLVYLMHGEISPKQAQVKLVAPHVRLVRFPQLAAQDASRWVEAMARKRVALAPGAAGFLYEYTGGSLSQVDSELDKLAAYCGGREATQEDCRVICVAAVENRVFDMIADLKAGRSDRALAAYRGLLASGEAPARILAAISGQLRVWAWLPQMQAAGLSAEAAAKALGVQRFVVDRALRGRPEAPDRWLPDLRACAEADWAFKSGQRSEESAVEALLLRIAARA